jgi:hypothetical protein
MPGSSPLSREPLLAEKSPNSQLEPKGSAAIIAIHAVGRHLTGASAEVIATLVSSLGRPDRSADPETAHPYCPGFREYSIEVPLARVATEFQRSTTNMKTISKNTLSDDKDQHQCTFWQRLGACLTSGEVS